MKELKEKLKENVKEKAEKVEEFCEDHFYTLLIGSIIVTFTVSGIVGKKYAKENMERLCEKEEQLNKGLEILEKAMN